MVKIAFSDDEGNVETLWAHDLGGGRYRLDSSSWYQYRVSWKDVVTARPDAAGQLCFVNVVEKSGHRTVRVLFEEATEQDNPILDGLLKLGCTFEGAYGKLFAIDIPPGVQLESIRQFLIENKAQWEHADPKYSDLYGD
jgi:Domain of unknown function (DUF4265)